jgi:superfamily I DNA/RNA helicase
MGEIEFSEYQSAIFEWIMVGRGNAIVNAVAGSGKTFTLEHAAHYIRSERAVFCAFNKHIAEELDKRLVGTPMKAKTIHSLGLGVLFKNLSNVKVDTQKGWGLAKKWANDHRFVLSGANIPPVKATVMLNKLANLACLTLTKPDLNDLLSLAIRFVPVDDMEVAQAVIPGIPWILAERVRLAHQTGSVDFTDQVWLPTHLNMTLPQYDWIFVDECQDLNSAQSKLVIGMKSEAGRILSVGDERQAIMGFAGANADSFARLKTETEAQEFPLSICYRCPTTHLDLARDIVPHIQPRPDAPAGIYRTIKEAQFTAEVREGDIILCRTTAPLIRWCLLLIRQQVSARVRGRDIGKELTNLMRNIAKNSPHLAYKEFGAILSTFEQRSIEVLSREDGNEGRIESLCDKCAALRACWEGFMNCFDLDTLAIEIEGLFDDKRPSVWLSTVHRAKGLQNDRVFILHPEKLPLSWDNQRADEAEQEMNLKYVALTRSTNELIIVEA